jgi:hypothetical protein
MSRTFSELLRRWGARARTAAANRHGGMAVMGAVVALPLAVLAFSAVEYHRATMLRQDLQRALDSATLAVARSVLTEDEAIDALGAGVLEAALAPRGVSEFRDVDFTIVDGVVTGEATALVTPIIAGMLVNEIALTAESEVSLIGERLEIALVLDNTFSMNGTKLTETKKAARAFVDTLEAIALKGKDPTAVKISLVPFASTVRIGSATELATYRTAAWMDTAAQSPIHDDIFFNTPCVTVVGRAQPLCPNRFDLLQAMGQTWSGCVESRPMHNAMGAVIDYDIRETPPTPTDPNSLFVPYFAPDEDDRLPIETGRMWVNRYLADGSASTDWKVRQSHLPKYLTPMVKPADPGNGYKHGPHWDCQLEPVMRLTNNFGNLDAALNRMVPVGDTNIVMGLMWGWHTLSPELPFADGAAYGAQPRKIAIVMTDGENQIINNGGYNTTIYSAIGFLHQGRLGITTGTSTQKRDALNARLTALCNNMKAQGIEIYTIRVEVTTGTNAVLSACATDTSHFHDVSQATQLTTVFEQIANGILRPRFSN